MTDPQPKKPSRAGLYGPFAAAILVFAGWSLFWAFTANKVEAGLKAQQEKLISQGYRISVEPYHVGGYPYRMHIEFRNLSIAAPSGRGVTFPVLRADATAYALDKWVFAAPEGLTLSRGGDLGLLSVTGTSLRASASGLRNPIARIAIEGDDVRVAPTDPGHPFTFDSARKVQLYLRPNTAATDTAATDTADWLVLLTGAHGQPGRFVGDFSPDSPLDVHVEGTFNKVSAFHGVDFATGLKNWKRGGQVTGLKSEFKNGDLDVMIRSDALSADVDNRLSGRIDVAMNGRFKPLQVLSAAGLIRPEDATLARPILDPQLTTSGTRTVTLDFRDGKAYAGPLKVSNAPILP